MTGTRFDRRQTGSHVIRIVMMHVCVGLCCEIK